MIVHKKTDMLFDDYQWSVYPKNNPKINGKPDTTKFNRSEGYEVLYLINVLAEIWEFKNARSCIKMEKMIRRKLPTAIIIQADVKEWISKHWNA